MSGYKKPTNPHGRKTFRIKSNRKEIHAFHAKIIAVEHKPTEWPPTRDLCVGGYWKGKKVSA